MAASASAGIRIRSAPASKASTAASAAPCRALIASITRASVTTSPLKPISRRSRSVSTALERVAGCCGSSSGSTRWAVITLSTPADGGLEGRQFDLLQPFAAVGQHRQVQMGVAGGVAVAGKVLGASEHTRLLQPPLEGNGQGAARWLGSSPQARTLITGLAGLLLTSHTGPSTQFSPQRRACSPVQRP